MTKNTTSAKGHLILQLAREIEAEMKRLGMWGSMNPPDAAPGEAFGADLMTYEAWLQHVFLPRLLEAATSGSYPSQSRVAVAAARNFDGVEGAERLIDLLSRVDEAVEHR
jgi:uncharacterized protein YqcC (DUF446 family)